MQERYQSPPITENLSDAEIMSAIGYLDPDLSAETTGEGPGTVFESCGTLLAALTRDLACMCVYVRNL